MHYPKQDRLRIYAAAQIGLIQIEPNPNKQRKYIDFIDYYADLSEQEIIEFRTQYLNEEGEIMGLAQILRQEGRQEGRQEDRQEECISLVTRLLRRKFGIQHELEQSLGQLQALPVEKLEDLTEAIFDWTEISDLTEWLRQQLAGINRV